LPAGFTYNFRLTAFNASGSQSGFNVNASSADVQISTTIAAPDQTQPTIAITAPANNASVSGTITISGTAADNVALSNVQIQVDAGAFANATGLASWTYSLNTASLSLGNHTITARATDTSNLMRTVSITVTVVDQTAPTVPSNLTAVAVSSTQINLTWTASTDNFGVAGYRIYRAGTQIATSVGTAYQNPGLAASTLR
jgi:hypothetical protein